MKTRRTSAKKHKYLRRIRKPIDAICRVSAFCTPNSFKDRGYSKYPKRKDNQNDIKVSESTATKSEFTKLSS